MESVRTIWRTLFRDDPPANKSLEELAQDIEYVKTVFDNELGIRQTQASRYTLNHGDQPGRVREEVDLARRRAHAERTGIHAGDSPQRLIEETNLARARATAELHDHTAIIDDKSTPPSVDDGLAFLRVRCEGKLVDATYNSYCASIIRQYFSLRKKVSNKQEYAIMNSIMNVHLVNIRPQYDYDLHDMMKYNDCIGYVQRTTVRVFNQIIEIPFTRLTLEDLNVWRPASMFHQIKLQWKVILTLALLITAYFAASTIIHQFTSPTTTTITHNVQQPPSPPTQTDTGPPFYLSMIQSFSATTKDYATSSGKLVSGAMTSISSLWTTPEKGSFTKMYEWISRKEEKSLVESLLSQSWRKCQQASTKLLDLSKLATHHSISLMDATSNLLSVHSKATYTSAKVLMTKSAQKFTNWLENTNSTLRETIVPSMRTSLQRCYDYVIDSTPVAINKTKSLYDSVVAPSITTAKHAMVNSTLYVVHECPVMWTRALEIASSTTTSSWDYLNSLIYGAKSLSTEMTSLYSQTLQSLQPKPSIFYVAITWILSWFLQLQTYILLLFAALGWFCIRITIQLWRLIQIG